MKQALIYLKRFRLGFDHVLFHHNQKDKHRDSASKRFCILE